MCVCVFFIIYFLCSPCLLSHADKHIYSMLLCISKPDDLQKITCCVPCWIQTHNWGFRLSMYYWTHSHTLWHSAIPLDRLITLSRGNTALCSNSFRPLPPSVPGPRWASWNLGIFVCIRCAGIHRNLGVHISKVKSVNLDQWTQEQVQVRGRNCLHAKVID